MRGGKTCEQYINMTIGQNIRNMRNAHNMSQAQIAGLLGMSFQQIQKYEVGKNRISAANLFILSQLLNTPVEAFFEGVVSKKKGKNQ